MPFDNIILAEGCTYTSDSSVTGINNNILVCGSSGCGKTMSISEPRLIETHNSSLITTVTKRRIINKYAPMFRKRGYAVWDLDFVTSDNCTVSYDPLQYIKSNRDITFLAESIVKSNPRKENSVADPYWDEAATSLLSAEIAFTLYKNPNATFTDVLKMHDDMTFSDSGSQITTSYDSDFRMLSLSEPSSFAVTCWKTFRQLPIKTASCVFGTLNSALDTVFSSELREMMSLGKNVDFEQLASHKTVLFITTSPVNPALNSFVNMFYGHAFKQLFEFAERLPDGALPIPVHMLCDDFATGSRILNFPEYISIFREKRISVTLLLQSESQLESMYGENDATTIINNCDTYIYMGGMDLKTARNISIRLNAPIDDVLYMPIGEVAVFRRGQRPIVTKRYNITSNETFKAVTRHYEKVKASIEAQGTDQNIA